MWCARASAARTCGGGLRALRATAGLSRQIKGSVGLASLLLALASARADGAGQQQLSASDNGSALQLVIWYPSASVPTQQSWPPFYPTVAVNAAIRGQQLPLVVISHGTGGSAFSHFDTALALADAGFVVVALTHTGDNYKDQSRAGSRINLTDRPRQVSRTIDYLLHEWPERGRLNGSRIGMFGFSLGGFTTLVLLGGVPDLSRVRQLCADNPSAPDCEFIRSHRGDGLDPKPVAVRSWAHDPRIKAAVIAAPAASYGFGPGSLRGVAVPVQLWTAANDRDAPARWNSDLVLRGLPESPETHVVQQAGHKVFLTPDICDPGTPDLNCLAFHQRLNAAIVRFFNSHL